MKKILLILINLVFIMGCDIDNSRPDSSIYDFVDNKDTASMLIGHWERRDGNKIIFIQFNEFYGHVYTNSESYNYKVVEDKIYFDKNFIADITSLNDNYMVLTFYDNTMYRYIKKNY